MCVCVCVCVYRNGKGLILNDLHFSNYTFEKDTNCSQSVLGMNKGLCFL